MKYHIIYINTVFIIYNKTFVNHIHCQYTGVVDRLYRCGTDVIGYPGGRGCQILQPDYDIRSWLVVEADYKRRISISLLSNSNPSTPYTEGVPVCYNVVFLNILV